MLSEVDQLLDQIDACAARLDAIGSPVTKLVRVGVVDSMVTDANNPLVSVLRHANAEHPDLKISIGIFDYLACLEELRANRLDIAIVGIAGNEQVPTETEAIPLYRETSSLYCSPDHPCASVSDAQGLRSELANTQISAHSFVFNPIDKDLDPMLLGDYDGVAQDTIELTAYHALSSTHVGLLPDHYAAPWVDTGELVSLAPFHEPILSIFHGLRMRSARKEAGVEWVWQELQSRALL